MTMLMMTVSLRSDPVHLQLTSRRLLVGTSEGPSQGIPPVLLATPPLLTIRDVLATTLTTTTMVAQGLLLVLARLLVLVELVEAMTSTGRASRRTMRLWVCRFFLLFSLFGACCQRGRKLEGSRNFLMLCVATGDSCLIHWELVSVRWRVWESLKTLICVIILLCDSICIRYGHVWFVWIRCHLFMLGCLSLYTFVSCVVLEVVAGVVKCGSATLSCSTKHLCAWFVICITYILSWHYVQRPTGSMDVGGALSHFTKMWILAFYANLRIQFFIQIFRGRLHIHDSKSSVLYFIAFVSSNWVVINHQKGENCKCNQALMWVLVLMTT
jgi:hypothetical protein